METTTVTVTRKLNNNGTFRYQVNGEDHTKGSRREYTHASAYVSPEGKLVVWLHGRLDLALKGSPTGKWYVETQGWRKLAPVTIQEI